MKSKSKLKIISSIFAAVTISSLAIGLGVGLAKSNELVSSKNDNANAKSTDNSLQITPTQTTYDYYGSSSSNNSVISFNTVTPPLTNLSAFSTTNENKTTYQWQYSLTNTDNSWTNFSDANQDTYNLSNLPQELTSVDKFYVRCEVTINKNTISSNVITVYVKNLSNVNLDSYVPTISNLNTKYIINLENNSNNTIYMNSSKISSSDNLYWNNDSSNSSNIISFDINNITNINEITGIQLFSNNINSATETTINKTFSSDISKYITLNSNTSVATFSIPKTLFNSWLLDLPSGLTSINFELTIKKDTSTFNLQVGNINFYNINPNITTKNISLNQNTIKTDTIQFANNLTSLFNSNEISCTSNLLINTDKSSISFSLPSSTSKWTGEENYIDAPTNLDLSDTYYYAIGVNFSITLDDTTYNLIIYSNISTLNLYTSNLSNYSLPSLLGNQTVDALYDPNWTSNGYDGIIPYATASATTGLLGTGIPDTTGKWNIGAYWYIQNHQNISFGTPIISQIYMNGNYSNNPNGYASITDGTVNNYITSSDVVFDDENGYVYLNLTSLTSSDWSALDGQTLEITIPYTLGEISSSLTLSNLVFHVVSNPIQIIGSNWYNTSSKSNNASYSLNVNSYLEQDISANELGPLTYDWEYSTSENGKYTAFSSGNGSSTFTLSTLPNDIKEGDTLYIECVISINLYYLGTLGGSGSASNYITSPIAVSVLSFSN